jgi:hypothetical protein
MARHFMTKNTTTTKGAAAPENTARNLNPEIVERAREAYNLGCQEREILHDLAHFMRGEEGLFVSILYAAGYPLHLAEKYAELAADIGEEEDE